MPSRARRRLGTEARAPLVATLLVLAAGIGYAGAAVIPDALSDAPPEPCSTDAPTGGPIAVFGRYPSLARAQVEVRAAVTKGFSGVKVLHPTCSTWLAALPGIPDEQVGEEFRTEAQAAGFAVEIVNG